MPCVIILTATSTVTMPLVVDRMTHLRRIYSANIYRPEMYLKILPRHPKYTISRLSTKAITTNLYFLHEKKNKNPKKKRISRHTKKEMEQSSNKIFPKKINFPLFVYVLSGCLLIIKDSPLTYLRNFKLINDHENDSLPFYTWSPIKHFFYISSLSMRR